MTTTTNRIAFQGEPGGGGFFEYQRAATWETFAGKVNVVTIDIAKDIDIAENAGITGTPTIQFFKNKELLTEVKGVKQKSQYRQLIENNL